MSLQFEVDAVESDWLTVDLSGRPRDDVWRTLLLGPSGFEAYARVLGLPDPYYPGQPEAEIDEEVLDAAP